MWGGGLDKSMIVNYCQIIIKAATSVTFFCSSAITYICTHKLVVHSCQNQLSHTNTHTHTHTHLCPKNGFSPVRGFATGFFFSR